MVSGQDLDVPLTLQPGVAINGRVVFEGSQPTAAELQALSFGLVPPGSGGQVQSSGGGRVDAEGRFTFAGVIPDTYHFVTTWNAPAARDKWTIKASTANGREAFEAPLRVNPNETVDWTVTYTDKPTSLTGVFQDQRRPRGDRLLHSRFLGRPQVLDARLAAHPHDSARHRRRVQRQGSPAGRVLPRGARGPGDGRVERSHAARAARALVGQGHAAGRRDDDAGFPDWGVAESPAKLMRRDRVDR